MAAMNQYRRDEFVTQINALISSVRTYGTDTRWQQVVSKLEEARTLFEQHNVAA